MKKALLTIALLSLVACKPPMISDPSKKDCKCNNGECCTQQACPAPQQTPDVFNPEGFMLEGEFQDDTIGQGAIYEEIPEPNEETI